MTAPPKSRVDRSVLHDRLQLALAAPHRATSWHWLLEAAAAYTGPDRADLLEAVRRRRPAEGATAILVATFLDSFAADESELAIASQAYLRCELPVDAGLALLNLTYARGLRGAGGSGGIAALLRGAAFIELSRRIGTRLLGESPARAARPAGRGNPRKVAVVAPTLSTSFHAPTQMALAHACLLQEQGLEVAVFAPQEHLMPGMAHWLGAPRKMALDAPDRSNWPRPRRGSMPVVLATPALSMRGRWHSLLGAIERFAPDVVFFIGAYSPLLWPLQARYPVAGLGTNTLAPVGPLHLWLAPAADAPPTWSPELVPAAVREHTRRLHMTISAGVRPRARLGLPESGAVWISSSHNPRGELTAQWCARVRDALERHPGARWLLAVNTKNLPAYVAAGHPRVVVAGFQKDLGATMRACDIYLNPPRVGGGHSVAMAMAHGLPALSLAGSDGGDKTGSWAVADEAAYFETLDRWTGSARLRREAGAAQRERFARRFDLAPAGPMLVDALAQAMQSSATPADGSRQASLPA